MFPGPPPGRRNALKARNLLVRESDAENRGSAWASRGEKQALKVYMAVFRGHLLEFAENGWIYRSSEKWVRWDWRNWIERVRRIRRRSK